MRLIKILLPLSVLLLTRSNVSAQSKNCFAIGSSKNLVRNTHGVPSSIYKNSDTKETWYYGKSSITFNEGSVSEYDNYGRNLKVCKEVIPVMTPELKERAGYLQPERSKSKAAKAATEEWILEKLNKYTAQDVELEGYYSTVSHTQKPSAHIRNTTFTIENGSLVARMRVDEGRNSREETFSIPINTLSRIQAEKGEILFSARPETISRTSGRDKSKESYFAIKFDFQTEADIKQRMVSAFSHLQKFYKLQKKKEVF